MINKPNGVDEEYKLEIKNKLKSLLEKEELNEGKANYGFLQN